MSRTSLSWVPAGTCYTTSELALKGIEFAVVQYFRGKKGEVGDLCNASVMQEQAF
jgi:hypothetical protein